VVLFTSFPIGDGLPLLDGARFSCPYFVEALYLVVLRCHSFVPVVHSFSGGTQYLSQG
jgi:hypothetical protein